MIVIIKPYLKQNKIFEEYKNVSKEEKIIQVLKIIFLVLIIIFVSTFVFLIKYHWTAYLYLALFIIIMACYITIHILKSKIYIYTCPKCQHQFKISFFKDVTAYNAGNLSKILVCPHCGIKEVMKASVKKLKR